MGELVLLEEEQVAKISERALALVRESDAIIVKTHGDAEMAAGLRKTLKAKYKELDEERKKATAPLDVAKKTIMDWFRKPLEALDNACGIIDKKLIDFDRAEKARIAEEQKRLTEEAEKKAATERARLEKQAEKAEAKGNVEKAEELREKQEEIMPAIPILADAPKVVGISYREIWSAEIENVDVIPREYMIPNIEVLNKMAIATKGLMKIPGVKFTSRQIAVGR